MLSCSLGSSPRLTTFMAMVTLFAASLMVQTTNGQTGSRNGLRNDTRTYRVPERVGLSDMQTEETDEQNVPRRTRRANQQPAQPGRQTAYNENPAAPTRVKTQGSVPANRRRGQVKKTNYQTGYIPNHLRTASRSQPPIVGRTQPMRSTVASRLMGQNEEEIYYEGEVGGPVEEFIDGDCCGSCDACEVGSPCLGGFCDRANSGVCGCGDLYNCPMCQECWLNGFGGLICNTEFFGGAHSFDLINLGPRQTFGIGTGQFGFHGGVNIGLTLKRLTCGLVSGQVGAAMYQSDFGGDGVFTNETREQVFFTAGMFRRVDYGLQFGVVADILFEDWFYQTEMVQMRSEISYVYGDGSLLGFRFTKGIQDGGDGHPFAIQPDVLDTYRFFWRMPAFNGLGWAEVFGGFSEESHGVIGAETDINITRLLSVQSGFTYVWEDEFADDSWNVYMRMVLRPAARNWYRNYHRPFMPVADNGSMITVWR